MATKMQKILLLNCLLSVNLGALGVLQFSSKCPKNNEWTPEDLPYSPCPSTIVVNCNSSRIPEGIITITCNKNSESCNCPNKCVQLRAPIDTYNFNQSDNGKIIGDRETYHYNSGCVCSGLLSSEGGVATP